MAPLPQEQVVNVRAELDNAVVVRPGDKLICTMLNRLNERQADTIKTRLAEKLPGVDLVIISECSGLAVYRDDPTAVRKIAGILDEEQVNALRAQGRVPAGWPADTGWPGD